MNSEPRLEEFSERIFGRGVVLCLSGPSGVGKGTVIGALMKKMTELRLSVSLTTRKPRAGEKEGKSYFFRTEAEFKKLIDEGEVLEYDCYCGNLYGTPKRPVDEYRDLGKDVIMDVTVKGSFSVKQKDPSAVTVFLLPPSMKKLEERLKGRGTEEEETVRTRLGFAVSELKQAKKFDYILVNNNIEETAEKLNAIFTAEHQRPLRLEGIEDLLESL